MCGIVGLISKRASGFWQKEAELFENMLHIDRIRGKDSTGAFGVQPNGQVKVVKIGSGPEDLFATNSWDDFKTRISSTFRIVIGHNRKATQGSVSSQNAHPFYEPPIVLVHNGMIFNHKTLNKTEESDVDSHSVCKAFAAGEHRKVLEEIDGAFAFVWYDTKLKKLFAVRNEQRPLFLVHTADFIAVSSEPNIPILLLNREGIKPEGVEEVKAGQLYEFEKSGGKYTTSDVRFRGKYVEGVSRPKLDVLEDKVEAWLKAHAKASEQHTNIVPFRNGAFTEDEEEDGVLTYPHIVTAPKAAIEITDLRGVAPVVGDVVLIEVEKFRLAINQDFTTIYGHIVQPDIKQYDAQSTIAGLTLHQRGKMVGSFVLGTITRIHWSQNGGPTAYLKDIKEPTWVKCHHDERVPLHIAQFAVNHCRCVECYSSITQEELPWTKVGLNDKRKTTILCTDCIEKRMAGNESYRKIWVEKRNEAIGPRGPRIIALQNGERSSKVVSTDSLREATHPGPASVQ